MQNKTYIFKLSVVNFFTNQRSEFAFRTRLEAEEMKKKLINKVEDWNLPTDKKIALGFGITEIIVDYQYIFHDYTIHGIFQEVKIICFLPLPLKKK